MLCSENLAGGFAIYPIGKVAGSSRKKLESTPGKDGPEDYSFLLFLLTITARGSNHFHNGRKKMVRARPEEWPRP